MGGRDVKLLLDTHVIVWWLAGEEALSRDQTEAMETSVAAGDRLGLSAISLWEIAKLVERGRLRLRCAPDAFFARIDGDPSILVIPLTSGVASESTRLGPSFPKDPADQIIAATARVHGLRLVTADSRIRACGAVSIV
jgi:PIN domain nuclease of toxin-antitoxin system